MVKFVRNLSFVCVLTILFAQNAAAQTTADFEDLNLNGASYYNGADEAGNFFSNGVEFYNRWDTAWGGFWGDGFAYTNSIDDSTGTYNDPYSCYAGYAMGDSGKFVVGQAQAFYQTHLKIAGGSEVAGMYVTNNTYAALSMLNGDAFGKKFGSDTNASGAIDSTFGKDWFKLTILGYMDDTATSTVDFYLADYRFENDSLDYIVKDWTWVDLRSLGTVDSVRFVLTSSDFSGFGINTPGYFCMDNFTLLDSVTTTFVDTAICPGSSAMILGNSQTASGVWFDTITADSVVAYNLEVYETSNVYFELPDIVCEDTVVNLETNTSVTSATFSGDGVDSVTFDAANVTIGVHTMMVNYVDTNQCDGSYQKSFEVVECGGVNIGINELDEMVRVFPSITSGQLSIEAPMWEFYEVQVMDLNGSIVKSLSNRPVSVDFSDVPAGMYIVKVFNGQTAFTTKIVRQ